MLKCVQRLYRCFSSESERDLEANLFVMPIWNALVHITEWSRECMNSISDEPKPKVCLTPQVLQLLTGIHFMAWDQIQCELKMLEMMSSKDAGSSALPHLSCKSTPIEIHYLLIQIQIYKPSERKTKLPWCSTYPKKSQILSRAKSWSR